MNLDLLSLSLPIRLKPETPMSDEDLSVFSEENNPFRMEREANGEILIMTPTVTDSAFINRRIVQALGVWVDDDGRGQVSDSSTGFKLRNCAIRSPDAAWVSNARWNALRAADAKDMLRSARSL